MSSYKVTINDGEELEVQELLKGLVLPEILNSIKIEFRANEGEGINTLSLMLVLSVLLNSIKNKTEYTVLLASLTDCMLIIKKLEAQVSLGDDRY